MERMTITPRQNWSRRIEALGFDWYKLEGTPYWYESAYYKFTAAQIDEIEAACNSLHDMCLQAVDHIVKNRLFPLLGISSDIAALITRSWERRDPSLYGRFDLIYDGVEPPKMLEYNADTPTSLFEASIVQWQWREDLFPKADQFNSIHESLVARWRSLLVGRRDASDLHVTCVTPMPEDEATVQYIGATAGEAGYSVTFVPIQDLGWDSDYGLFRDMADKPIRRLFKLYPWEWIVNEDFGRNVEVAGMQWIEPAWKMLLSNKGILATLWDLFPGHENLAPAYLDATRFGGEAYVRKPLLGREGSNIEIRDSGGAVIARSGGNYADTGYVYQGFIEPPCFNGAYRPNLGAWMINGMCHGMGIREDDNMIIGNESRFVPHIFE